MKHLSTKKIINPLSILTWPDSLKWLEILISHDTTSCQSNFPLIYEIRDALIAIGLEPELISTPDVKNKSNLLVSIPAKNGLYTGGVMLSGHTDTVPITGQNWYSNPFVLTDKTGDIFASNSKKLFPTCSNNQKKTTQNSQERRLYGRGTCDMKGFIAVCLASIPKIIQSHLPVPVHIALSYDEEIGCLGVPLMLKSCLAKGIKPDLCIVGEPTSMRPVLAHKSVSAFSCQVYGHATHSSLTPKGVNAIEYAARMINKIRNLANKKHPRHTFDENFDIPFATTQTGVIQGGNAINIVPEYCEFSFEIRTILNKEIDQLFKEIKEYADKLMHEMQKISKETSIHFKQLESIPALEHSENLLIKKIIQQCTNLKTNKKVAYATEAGIFAQNNIPTLICGPGNIEQAHRANEYISFSQLKKCEIFIEKIINFFSSSQ